MSHTTSPFEVMASQNTQNTQTNYSPPPPRHPTLTTIMVFAATTRLDHVDDDSVALDHVMRGEEGLNNKQHERGGTTVVDDRRHRSSGSKMAYYMSELLWFKGGLTNVPIRDLW